MKTKTDNTEMPPIMVRLQEFITHMNLSVYQVNRTSGLCQGLLSNAFSKKQGLTTSTLERLLLAYPMLNANWLITGQGQMLIEEKKEEEVPPTSLQAHLQNLQTLQDQCVEMIKQIQQMKQKEQADADARLLNSLS